MLSPAENTVCIGHEPAMRVFEEARLQGRLAHSWLLSGPEGVGKRTLAYHFIRALLAPRCFTHPFSAEAPFVRRIAARSHPDFFLLQDPTIEGIRSLHGFLQKSPVEGVARAALLPQIDILNPSASNALLKTLEEPAEHSFFFLTAQRLGSILPTIRSRCRILPLSPLGRQKLEEALKDVCAAQGVSPLSPERLEPLWQQTQGCLGKAVRALYELGDAVSPLLSLHRILEKGLLPLEHPDFEPPFHPQNRTFWSQTPFNWWAEELLSWIQNRLVETGLSSSGRHPDPLPSWTPKTPLEAAALYDALRNFLEEALVFNSDPQATAAAAIGILRGDFRP